MFFFKGRTVSLIKPGKLYVIYVVGQVIFESVDRQCKYDKII